MLADLFANMSSKMFKDLYVLEDQIYLEADQEKRFTRIKQIAGRASELGEIFVDVPSYTLPRSALEKDGLGLLEAFVLTGLAKGKTIAGARNIEARDVIRELGGLPPDHEHCARLAVATLRAALRDHVIHGKAPWKRLYQAGR